MNLRGGGIDVREAEAADVVRHRELAVGRDVAPRDVLVGRAFGLRPDIITIGKAIASGVPPQHGLYTAIIAGIVVSALGGSRFQIAVQVSASAARQAMVGAPT